jgi:hypothetical protein
VYLDFVESSEENVSGGHTRIFTYSEGASGLLNTLEERLCRVNTTKVTKISVNSTRSVLSRCIECIGSTLGQVLRMSKDSDKRKVSVGSELVSSSKSQEV